MKRASGMIITIAVIPALISGEILLNLVHFNYSLFQDPFSPIRFVVKLGVLVAFTWLYGAVLQYFWKRNHD